MAIKKQKKNLIIFDVDGVFLKSDVLYSDIAREYFKHEITPTQMRPYITKGGTPLFNAITGKRASKKDIATFREAQINIFKPKRHLYVNTTQVMMELKINNILAIVSNKPERIIREILEISKMSEMFLSVIGLDSGFAPKPSPDGIIVTKNKFPSEKNWYIGDAHTDYIAATAAATDFIYCTHGFDPEPILHRKKINHLAEIKEVITR